MLMRELQIFDGRRIRGFDESEFSDCGRCEGVGKMVFGCEGESVAYIQEPASEGRSLLRDLVI